MFGQMLPATASVQAPPLNTGIFGDFAFRDFTHKWEEQCLGSTPLWQEQNPPNQPDSGPGVWDNADIKAEDWVVQPDNLVKPKRC